MKLHGSLNWAQCKDCGKIVPWEVSSYLSESFIQGFPVTGKMTLPIGSEISHFKHCEGNVEREPFLVPPTWNKMEQHRALSSVWARAAKELGEAESIFVIGYSLPLSDYFFRHLYALGAVGEATLRRFWVFNPDRTGEVERRFKELLGHGALQRFRYFPETFETSFDVINKRAFSRDTSRIKKLAPVE